MRAMILQGAATRVADLRAVMGERDFARYAAGNFAATTAFWMQRIAIGWLTWSLTQSELWLGIVAFAELFPSIVSTFAGGALADRYSRPLIMRNIQYGQSIISAMLCLLFMFDLLDIWVLTLIMGVLGIMGGIMLPSRLSLPHLLVGPAKLPSALAVNSTTFNLSRLLGPAIAAPVLLWFGAEAVFALALIGNLYFARMLVRIMSGSHGKAVNRSIATYGDVLKDLFRSPVLVGVISLQFAQGVLIRPASELFPAFADVVFGAGETGLAALNAALGAGAVVGALASSKLRVDRAALDMILWVSVLFALSLAVFALVSNLWVAVLVLIVHGAMMTSSNIAALTYVQLRTPSEQMGRVLSVYGVVFRAAPAIGAIAFGAMAEVSDLHTATFLFAVLALLATIPCGLAMRR